MPLSQRSGKKLRQLLRCTAPPWAGLPNIMIDRRRGRRLRERLLEGGGEGSAAVPGWPDDSVTFQTFKQLAHARRCRGTTGRSRTEQWWEVNFIGEGIIDQGGGFRDLLTEIADELCPPDAAAPFPSTPLFVRSPNQAAGMGPFQDCYVLNPSCTALKHLGDVGRLMGGALRSDESLPIALPPLFWKRLSGEPVSFSRDFATVDYGCVLFAQRLAASGPEALAADGEFDGLCLTINLSDTSTKELFPRGAERWLTPEHRDEYLARVREARMEEDAAQLAALRAGLESVVPREVLSLLTWQEIERRVCGNPEIAAEDIRVNCRFQGDVANPDVVVADLFAALERFSRDELELFLRFVTGRRRLPAKITIKIGGSPEELPKAATCVNMLYLPVYPDVDTVYEKVRYAIVNCVAIDNDTQPWDARG